MESPDIQIENLLSKHLSPIKVAFFFNEDQHQQYRCIHSSIGHYKTKENYLIYDLPSILRVLCLKRGLFSENMETELYRQSLDEVCFILDWEVHAKKVLIFEIKDLKHWDQENFLTVIKENSRVLNDSFDEYYFRNRGNE